MKLNSFIVHLSLEFLCNETLCILFILQEKKTNESQRKYELRSSDRRRRSLHSLFCSHVMHLFNADSNIDR